MDRCYSTFEVKSVSEDERIIEGTATTPTADRVGDIVEPSGAQFKLPIPLLWQHNAREPVGHVEAVQIGADGIRIKARIVKVPDAGRLRDRVDEAWQSLKLKLVRGLSLGFKPLDAEPVDAKNPWGGQRFKKWEWIELSAVTVPANAEATIATVKRLSTDQLAVRELRALHAGVKLEHEPTDARDENSKGWSRWWAAEFNDKGAPWILKNFEWIGKEALVPMFARVKKLETRTASTDALIEDLERRLADLEAKR